MSREKERNVANKREFDRQLIGERKSDLSREEKERESNEGMQVYRGSSK